MRSSWGSWLALLGVLTWTPAAGASEVKNVAIIGAGAAGSSAAYHLATYAKKQGLNINITVFEKTDHVGGRSLTVDAFGDHSQPIELGASIFVSINHILFDASKEFGIPLSDPQESENGDITAIWDGKKILYETVDGSSWWWDAAKMWWKYGLAPYRAIKLVKSVVESFMKLYEEPHFPFESLTAKALDLGLVNITGLTGEQLLEKSNINIRFARDILQAATRVNYASNLAYIHGLETMVSFATDGAVSANGGNWKIFDKMIRASGASINRNTTVASISAVQKRTETPTYVITTKQANPESSTLEEYSVEFDNIVIACPWQFSQIDAGEGVLQDHIDEIPYTKLHVTLFSSPLKLSPKYFGLSSGRKAPSNVYTTLSEDDVPKQGAEGVGSAGFYSVSTLKQIANPKTGKLEYAYKIFSAEPVTPKFLSKLFAADIPDNFVGEKKAGSPISWYYPHWFYSYPVELPRVTFQDPIVGNGVYYTSGMESFISTMETSALMGKNVARLIADDLSTISHKGIKDDKPIQKIFGAKQSDEL
ncbi:Prenylcysteine lyase-domain-containing protein [Mariannaea sp. PMI_226]|nr:Prenylcysteine lyase-domain-containing protein [Mariannaea sp. PMI_226]